MLDALMDFNVDYLIPMEQSMEQSGSSEDLFSIECDALDDGFWENFTQLSPTSPSSCWSDQLDPFVPDLVQTCEDLTEDICRRLCETFDSSSAACDCTCLSVLSPRDKCFEISPVLKDCMWSATSGLIPFIVPLNNQLPAGSSGEPVDAVSSKPSCRVGDNSNHSADLCSICTSCVTQTALCVDPKTVFPYHEIRQRPATDELKCDERSTSTTSESTSYKFVYDHDSETSAYSSAVSDDELEEVDVVSVASCNNDSGYSQSSPSPVPADQSQSTVRRQMLVLPASESMSAQVAAMHNYSSTRCRPSPQPSSSNLTTQSLISKRCAKRLVGKATSRKRRRAAVVSSPSSDSSEDSWPIGGEDDDRCRRAQHNVMERRRRHHLKGNFFRLRDVIPEISGDTRVSKVAILCRARDYIERLGSTEDKLKQEFDRLRAIQTRLKWKLSLLQRDQRLATAGGN